MSSERAIPYGVADFKRIRNENYYYIDKTAFIAPMERRDSFIFFVRPRRFGKTLLIDTLRCYYDVAEKENFPKLFGGLYAGAHPTANANKYFVLALDFSRVGKIAGSSWEEKFESYANTAIKNLILAHRDFLVYEFKGRELYRLAEVDPATDEKIESN